MGHTQLGNEQSLFCYPAIRSVGWDSKFTVCFLCVYTVTDFSVGALPIGMKFCMAIRPDLGQVFSYFGETAPGMAKFWASTGRHMAGYATC